jgi:hypothetical protein
MAETRENRIRECAYHIWEASGRPSGRDEEFWQRACEMIATAHDQQKARVQQRQPKQAQPAQQSRKRSRRTSSAPSSGVATPAG